jgi:hypothetical protein
MKRFLTAGLVGAALAALATTWLIAQPVIQNQLSGNECWNAGQGAGGVTAGFVCTNVIRNGTANTLLATETGNWTVGANTNLTFVTGSSWSNFPSSGETIVETAQPSAGTITMPPSPVTDGAVVRICNGTNSAFATNAVTVAANTNQTMVPTGASVTLTTLAAATCVAYQFSLSNTSWYKVQ